MSNSIHPASVIRRTLGMYADRASALLPLSAVVFGVVGILDSVLINVSSDLIYITFVVSDIATTVFAGLVVKLVADAQDGRHSAGVRQLIDAVRPPVLLELVVVGVIAGIGVFVGFVVIVVPGLILITMWSVAAPVVVLEQPGGLRALGVSRELVRGNGWRVFCVIFVMLILVGLVSSGIDLAAGSAAFDLGMAVRVVVEIVTAPLGAVAIAVLYFDLRQPPSSLVMRKAVP